MNIDHNTQEDYIASPHDDELTRLNGELNKTYIAYGSTETRDAAGTRQAAQDKNAAATPAAILSRVKVKASRLYVNSAWDLVDAVNENRVDLAQIDKQQLPEELRELSVDELKAHVATQAAKRAEIQAQIKKLSAERTKFVAGERAKRAPAATASLEDAIIESVRDQAEAKEFDLGDE